MKSAVVLINASFFGCISQTKSESMACVQRDPFAREIAPHVPEFGHPAELCFREYGAVMTDQIRSDDAGSAYSDTTLEHPFQANLDVAARFHCEVIDLLHHRLGTTSVDRVKMSVLQNGLGDLRDLILLSVRSVVSCENEFEIVFFAVRYQPVFEEELAGGPRSRDKSHVASAEMNQKR